MTAQPENDYVREAIDAIARYAEDGGALTYQSEAVDDGGVIITFRLADADSYHTALSTVMVEDLGSS